MKVPAEFQAPIKAEYPPHNREIFEQWLIHNIGQYESDRIYLPINWCGYFVNHKYGADRAAMRRLQRFMQGLDSGKKYWTVTQYDLGIIVPIEHLDIKVFGSGGGRIDFPIPLVCHPHGVKDQPKDLFANFVGSITHPIRERLKNTLKDSFVLCTPVGIDSFCEVLSRSTFTLCPRGFGLTSFRIAEALEQGSIPVYISDKHIIPFSHDFNDYGVLIWENGIDNLEEILKAIPEHEIERKRENGKRIYQEMYTYEGLHKMIIENL